MTIKEALFIHFEHQRIEFSLPLYLYRDLLPPVVRAFLLAPPKEDSTHENDHDDNTSLRRFGLAEAPLFCLVPLVFTSIGTIVLFFYWVPIRALLETIFTGMPS